MPDTLYVLAGDVFEPTGLVRGPWSYDHSHAGPPAALLTDRILRMQPEMAMTRVTVDIPGPIPIAPMRVESEVLRPGRKISNIAASLVGLDGRTYARAQAWLMRIDENIVRQTGRAGSITQTPEASEVVCFEFWDGAPQFGHAVEIRTVSGEPFSGKGPSTAWIRLKVPVVDNEDPLPEVRIMAAADFPNGLSSIEPIDRLLCINTDVTVYLGRKPVGEWIGLDSSTNSSGLGLGMTDSLLYDASGFIGTANQSIFFDSLNGREPGDGT